MRSRLLLMASRFSSRLSTKSRNGYSMIKEKHDDRYRPKRRWRMWIDLPAWTEDKMAEGQ
jgi:hypothetical protein